MQTASYLGFALLCSSASSSLGQAIGGRILTPRKKEMNLCLERCAWKKSTKLVEIEPQHNLHYLLTPVSFPVRATGKVIQSTMSVKKKISSSTEDKRKCQTHRMNTLISIMH